jgi:hypothetical protein
LPVKLLVNQVVQLQVEAEFYFQFMEMSRIFLVIVMEVHQAAVAEHQQQVLMDFLRQVAVAQQLLLQDLVEIAQSLDLLEELAQELELLGVQVAERELLEMVEMERLLLLELAD